MEKSLEWYLCLLFCLLFYCSSTGVDAANQDMSTKQFTYQNPIKGGPEWMWDCFILKVGDTYYLTGTTGNTGVRVWSSKNLTKWFPIENGDEGYILRNEAIP